MFSNRTIAPQIEPTMPAGPISLSDDDIQAVGGGVGPLFRLAVFVGILVLAGTCAKCN